MPRKVKKAKVDVDACTLDINKIVPGDKVAFVTRSVGCLTSKIKILKNIAECPFLTTFTERGVSFYTQNLCQSVHVFAHLDLNEFGSYKFDAKQEHAASNISMQQLLRSLNHAKAEKHQVVMSLENDMILINGEGKTTKGYHRWKREVPLTDGEGQIQVAKFVPEIKIVVDTATFMVLLQGQIPKTSTEVFFVYLEVGPDYLSVSVNGRDMDKIEVSNQNPIDPERQRICGAKYNSKVLLSLISAFHVDKRGSLTLEIDKFGIMRLRYLSKGVQVEVLVSCISDE